MAENKKTEDTKKIVDTDLDKVGALTYRVGVSSL